MSGRSEADENPHRVTELLSRLRSGSPEVMQELTELVYNDLRRVAERRLGSRRAVTLEPAALVNECWMRLIRQRCDYENRPHFLAVASRLMLRVLVDHERRRGAERRGGGRERVTLNFEIPAADEDEGVDVAILGEALDRLETVDSRKAEVVRLRFLAGLTIAETAAQLDLSEVTVERDWAFARAWLSREVQRLKGTD